MFKFSEDLEKIIFDSSIPWEKLLGSTILVTGATGSIGKAVVSVLGELNRINRSGINIIAAGRDLAKGRAMENIDGVRFIAFDIRERFNVPCQIDYIFHCAAVTESVKMVSDPIGVIETELYGGKNILEFAVKNNVKGMVYTSSMEVYGRIDLESVGEGDMGYLDLTNPRCSYPQAKRMMEALCNSYFYQYELPVNIVRLGMTFGAGMDYSQDKRVWAQFARCVHSASPIVLHTPGKTLRSFVYITDALSGMFLVLLGPKYGETYNVASVCITIKEMADRVANRFGLKVILDPPANIDKMGYAGDFNLPLNSGKLKNIGWKPFVTEIEEMFARTIADEN
jgi:dTDP-glucose 4,6-dehydratase